MFGEFEHHGSRIFHCFIHFILQDLPQTFDFHLRETLSRSIVCVSKVLLWISLNFLIFLEFLAVFSFQMFHDVPPGASCASWAAKDSATSTRRRTSAGPSDDETQCRLDVHRMFIGCFYGMFWWDVPDHPWSMSFYVILCHSMSFYVILCRLSSPVLPKPIDTVTAAVTCLYLFLMVQWNDMRGSESTNMDLTPVWIARHSNDGKNEKPTCTNQGAFAFFHDIFLYFRV